MTLNFLPLPSAEELRKLFDYKPDGALYWKHCNNSQVSLDKPAGWHRRNGYCEIKIGNKSYKRNRLIWCYFNNDPGEYEVDHINRIKNDDRIENLRLATRKQNQWNRAVLQANKAGFKGIHKDHSGKWRAQITGPDGKTMHLGRYDTPGEASVAYTVAANFIQGDFAYSRLDTPPPKPGKPTAWMYQGEDDFDGIRWRENWEVTIDEKLARFKSGNKEPIPLFKAHDLAPSTEPPTDEGIATAFQKGADQEFYAIVEALTEYCDVGVELTDSDVSEVLYELRRKQNTKTKPEPPTDEELRKLWLDLYATNDGPTSGEVVVIARAVLERWGNG